MLPFHPAADRFPMLGKEELKALAADIKDQGLLDAITIDYDGKLIIDGRNRAKACEIAGVEPRYEKLAHGIDPVQFILSKNCNRRDLTKGQKAIIVARIVVDEYSVGSTKQVPWDKIRKTDPRSKRHERARAAGISPEYLSHALTILQYAPLLEAGVKDGSVSFDGAYLVALKDSEKSKHGKKNQSNKEEKSQPALMSEEEYDADGEGESSRGRSSGARRTVSARGERKDVAHPVEASLDGLCGELMPLVEALEAEATSPETVKGIAQRLKAIINKWSHSLAAAAE
jgi:hypothetical protein